MLLCGVAALSAPAIAQTARSGGGGTANAQAMQQLQQLASERTALQADNAKLKQQLADMQKERDALKAREQALGQRLRSTEAVTARAASTRESSEKELNDLKGRSQELIAKFRETAQALRDVEVDRAAARQSLTAREGELKACVDRNAALYTLNTELVTRLESEGGWSRIARAEPFTRLKRIELENLADDYRTRAEDQRLAPAPAAAPAAAPATSKPR
jgi:chromosome segregation ATPase